MATIALQTQQQGSAYEYSLSMLFVSTVACIATLPLIALAMSYLH